MTVLYNAWRSPNDDDAETMPWMWTCLCDSGGLGGCKTVFVSVLQLKLEERENVVCFYYF